MNRRLNDFSQTIVDRVSPQNQYQEIEVEDPSWDIYYLPLSGNENPNTSLFNSILNANLETTNYLDNQTAFQQCFSVDHYGFLLSEDDLPMASMMVPGKEKLVNTRYVDVPDTIWSSLFMR